MYISLNKFNVTERLMPNKLLKNMLKSVGKSVIIIFKSKHGMKGLKIVKYMNCFLWNRHCENSIASCATFLLVTTTLIYYIMYLLFPSPLSRQ